MSYSKTQFAGGVVLVIGLLSVAEEVAPAQEAKVDESAEDALTDLPGLYFDGSYKVDPFIRAAVLLQALGKDKACEKLLELSADPRRGDRVIVLGRMLFRKKPTAEFRRPLLGAPVFLGKTRNADWPLEPIELVDGVPFLITRGYELGGKPERGRDYLKDYCMKECAWNEAAFKVPDAKTKQAALDNLLASPKWQARPGDEVKNFLAAQIERPVSVDRGVVSAASSWQSFERGYTDRHALTLGKSTTTIEVKPNRVVRRDATGKEEWATPLGKDFRNTYFPGLVGDGRRVIVRDDSGEVTALAADTGKVLWRTKAAEGYSQCFWLSGDLLLVGLNNRIEGRSAETGKATFNLVLPENPISTREIVEVAGLFLVWNRSHWINGSALLIDRTGKVCLRFPASVNDVIPAGKDWVCLTNRSLMRITMDNKTRWTLAFAKGRGAAGQFVKLSDGSFLACLYDPSSDSGVHAIRFDPDSGKKHWQTYCSFLGVQHSEYYHNARIDMVNGQVRVTSEGSSDTFVELLKLDSGQQIRRRVGRLEPIPGMTIAEAMKLGMNPKSCTIFDEPPGVARGVRGSMDGGRDVSLWISRTAGLFRENRDWTFEQLSGLKVVAVKEE